MSNVEYYEKRLADIKTEIDWCRQDMNSGIDYDYSQDRLDELDKIREETMLDYFSHKRRTGL